MEEQSMNLQKFDQAVLEGKVAWWQMELPSGDVFFGQTKTDMLGYSEEDFNHYQDFTELIHSDDHKDTMQAMRDHLEGKKDLYETVYRIKAQNGEYIKFYDLGQILEKTEDETTVIGFVMKVKEEEDIFQQMEDFKKLILKGKPSMMELVKQIK